MAADGLTPAPETVAAIAAECPLPQMVMLRSARRVHRRRRGAGPAAARRQGAGARRARPGSCSASSTRRARSTWPPPRRSSTRCRRCRGRSTAPSTTRPTYRRRWRAVRLLPNLATVLTSGSPTGVADGPAGAQEPRGRGRRLASSWRAAGSSRPTCPSLLDYGVRAFHVGSRRTGGAGPMPVDAAPGPPAGAPWSTATDPRAAERPVTVSQGLPRRPQFGQSQSGEGERRVGAAERGGEGLDRGGLVHARRPRPPAAPPRRAPGRGRTRSAPGGRRRPWRSGSPGATGCMSQPW